MILVFIFCEKLYYFYKLFKDFIIIGLQYNETGKKYQRYSSFYLSELFNVSEIFMGGHNSRVKQAKLVNLAFYLLIRTSGYSLVSICIKIYHLNKNYDECAID
jgi:hypothetical protein